MAGALGDLVIALHADTAKFTSDMGRAATISEREWNKVARSAGEVAKQVAVAAALAGAAAIKMASDFISAAADLDDLAEKTGASVEELSKLEQQAHISGASMETLETGLIRLSKALHGTDEEGKGAGKALAALGLKADDLKNKDTAQALRIVAGELNKYADGAGKTALALDLFGRSGAQLLPILKDIATEGELNVRVTAKQAAEAEELGKSWRRLTNEARGVAQALALDIVPWLQRSIEQFREGIKIAGGFWEALRMFGTANPFRTTGESVANLNKSLESFRETRKELAGRGVDTTAMDAQIKAFEKRLEFAKLMQRQDALGLGGADTQGEAQRFALSGQKLTMAYESAGKAAKAAKDDTEKERQAQVAAQSRLMREDAKAMEDYRKQAEHFKERGYFENIFGDEAVGMSLDDLKAKFKATVDGAQALLDTWDRGSLMDAGFDETGKKIDLFVEKNAQAATEVSDFWRAAYESMQRAASDLFFDVMQGNFSSFGQRFKQTIDRMVADWLAAQALMEASAYAKRAVNGSTNFGHFVGTILNAVSGTQSGVDVPIREMGRTFTGYAEGTDYVPRTGLALLHQGEAVLTAEENATRGRATIINMTINTPNADSFRATIGQNMEAVRRAAFAGG